MKIKLSDYVMEFVAAQGIKDLFFLPGGGAMHLVDSLARQDKINPVCMLHEQAVAIAAGAYATYNCKLGVGLVTGGPGGTNAVTGVAAAWIDSTPCLFVSGQAKTADLIGTTGVRQMGNQEVDIVSIVRPITKYAVTILDPDSIGYHLEKAVHLAQSGRPGPVWIDIPVDIQGAMVDEASLMGFSPIEEIAQTEPVIAIQDKIKQTISLMHNSQRPVIIAGNGIRSARCELKFRELVNKLGIPVLTSWKAIDLMADTDPLFAGRSGTMGERGANFALQNSDWLLCLGTRLDMSQTGFDRSQFARKAKKIMVDIDQTEIAKLGEVIDIPVCTDAGLFISEFLCQLQQEYCERWGTWLEQIARWRKRYPLAAYRPKKDSISDGIDPYAFIDILSDELSEEDIIVPCNAGTTAEISYQALRIKGGQRVPTSHGLGSMGFDLPGSIGACLASGSKRTVCIAGDGGLQLNIQELATLQRLHLPIKLFVLDNRGYASIRAMQCNHFSGRLLACDQSSGLGLPDITSIAAAYGLPFSTITNSASLHDGIKSVLDSEGPFVCNVSIDPDAKVSPRTATRRCDDGKLVSTPLEDLWPFLDREELEENMIDFSINNDLGCH